MSRDPTYVTALKQLSRERGGIVEALIWPDISRTTQDRPLAITITSKLEDDIQDLIESAMVALTDSERAEIFSGDRMLGSFSARIQLAYALGLIGKSTRRDWHLIRHIRNTFAHARKSINFSTPEVAEACKHLSILERYPHYVRWKNLELPIDNARNMFSAAVAVYSFGIAEKLRPLLREMHEEAEEAWPPIPLD